MFSCGLKAIHVSFCLFILLPHIALCCYNSSSEMHRCLHLFMERDFYLVQDLFNFEPRDFRQAPFMLDEMELKRLCDNIKEMQHCYEEQLPSCYTFPFHLNLLRIVNSLHGVHRILCENNTTELISNGYCIEKFRKTNSNCDHAFDYRYPMVFLKIMRFQIGGYICTPLIKFQKCMIDPLMSRCDRNAMTIWNATLDTLVRGFCYRQQYINESNSTSSNLFTIIFISIIFSHFRFTL